MAASLAALTLAILAAGSAQGTDLDSDAAYGKKPLWSNDFHHLKGTIATRGCGLVPSPEYQAQYVPGVDAWDRPVIPAETIRPYGDPPIYGELDVQLRKIQVGSHKGLSGRANCLCSSFPTHGSTMVPRGRIAFPPSNSY